MMDIGMGTMMGGMMDIVTRAEDHTIAMGEVVVDTTIVRMPIVSTAELLVMVQEQM